MPCEVFGQNITVYQWQLGCRAGVAIDANAIACINFTLLARPLSSKDASSYVSMTPERDDGRSRQSHLKVGVKGVNNVWWYVP